MPPKSRRDGRGVGRRPQVQQTMYESRARSRGATTPAAREAASPWHSPEQRRSPVRQRSPVQRRSPVRQRSPAQQRSPVQQRVPVRQSSPVRRVVWEPQRAVQAAASERREQQSLSPTTSPKWHHPRDTRQRGRGSGSAPPSWLATAGVEWDQTCADSRHAGIKIPTGVPETAANRCRLKREIRLLSIRGELDDLNRSDWDEEVHCDVEELQVAMDGRGLSNPERVSLWCVSTFVLPRAKLDVVTRRRVPNTACRKDGVQSRALLEALRDEDLREHGIDICSLREEVKIRWSLDEKRRQQDAMEHTMAHVVVRGLSPGRLREASEVGELLDVARRHVQDGERELYEAMQRTSRAREAAWRVRRERDEQFDDVQRFIAGGASQFAYSTELNSGQLSPAALELVYTAVTSWSQLLALDLPSMRLMGLGTLDRRLLDSIREDAKMLAAEHFPDFDLHMKIEHLEEQLRHTQAQVKRLAAEKFGYWEPQQSGERSSTTADLRLQQRRDSWCSASLDPEFTNMSGAGASMRTESPEGRAGAGASPQATQTDRHWSETAPSVDLGGRTKEGRSKARQKNKVDKSGKKSKAPKKPGTSRARDHRPAGEQQENADSKQGKLDRQAVTYGHRAEILPSADSGGNDRDPSEAKQPTQSDKPKTNKTATTAPSTQHETERISSVEPEPELELNSEAQLSPTAASGTDLSTDVESRPAATTEEAAAACAQPEAAAGGETSSEEEGTENARPPQEVVLTCTEFRNVDKTKDARQHVQYKIMVTHGGRSYSIWRRWSACQKLDGGCYNLGGRSKDSKPRPAYSLNFPSRSLPAGSDVAALNGRRSDLDAYFKSFAQWINEVLSNSDYKMDLMEGDDLADRKMVIKSFFDQTAEDSSVNMTDTAATVVFKDAQRRVLLENSRQHGTILTEPEPPPAGS